MPFRFAKHARQLRYQLFQMLLTSGQELLLENIQVGFTPWVNLKSMPETYLFFVVYYCFFRSLSLPFIITEGQDWNKNDGKQNQANGKPRTLAEIFRNTVAN